MIKRLLVMEQFIDSFASTNQSNWSKKISESFIWHEALFLYIRSGTPVTLNFHISRSSQNPLPQILLILVWKPGSFGFHNLVPKGRDQPRSLPIVTADRKRAGYGDEIGYFTNLESRVSPARSAVGLLSSPARSDFGLEIGVSPVPVYVHVLNRKSPLVA